MCSSDLIVDPCDSILPTPYSWLLFPSPFIKRVALTNQLQGVFQVDSDIEIPFQCIWTIIHGIGEYQQSTAPTNQIKCYPAHKQAIQILFLELISLSAIDKQDPRHIFQCCIVFMTPYMLFISDTAYASLLLDQNDFQASDAIFKVTTHSICIFRSTRKSINNSGKTINNMHSIKS